MTAELPASSAPAEETDADPSLVVVLGLLAALLGTFLLIHPYDTAWMLALFTGAALVVGGGLEIAAGWDSRADAASAALGGVLVTCGALTALWPNLTLETLVLITGLCLVVHGVGRLVLAVAGQAAGQGWGLLGLAGGLNVALGVLALAWPSVTVLVLSLILGAQILVSGFLHAVAAFPGSGDDA